MYKYIFLLFSIVSLLFQSCEEDSFSQVVTIDIPEHEAKAAIRFSVEVNNPENLAALVTNSKGILDPDTDYKIPTDAVVKLFRNGDLLTQLSLNEESFYYEDFNDVQIRDTAGDVYLFEAELEGFDKVSATQTMPVKPIITDATYEREGTIDPGGYRADEIIVDINDPDPDNINYFGVRLFTTFYITDSNGDTINRYHQMLYLDSNDPLLAYAGNYGLVFTDESFSGGTFQARTYTYSQIQDDTEIEVEILSITKEAFLYKRSLEQYYEAVDNPFAEPVIVPSNIEGGYGFFTLANSTIFKIR